MTPLFDPDRTKGGLFIPDQAKERCDQGIVKYIAPDEDNFQVGDYVLFSAYDGTLASIEGELLIIMKSEAIVCTISPPEYLNTVISGLYFRSDKSARNLALSICDLIFGEDQSNNPILNKITEEIVKWELNKYFDANYEQAMDLISRNLTDLGYPNRFRFKDRKQSAPKPEEIKKYGRG